MYTATTLLCVCVKENVGAPKLNPKMYPKFPPCIHINITCQNKPNCHITNATSFGKKIWMHFRVLLKKREKATLSGPFKFG